MKRVPFVLFVVCLGAGLAASPQAQQQDKVQSSIGAGDMHMRFKDYAQAIADASNAIKLMDIPGNYENRAEIYEKQGDLDNATKDYTQAVNYRKKDLKKAVSKDDYAWKAESLYSLYLKRGDAYYYKRSWDRAIADFMAAEKLLLPGPDRAKIHLLIADVYEQKGDARNAAKYRQKAQDEDPGAKK